MPQCYDGTGHERCPGSLGGLIPCECACHVIERYEAEHGPITEEEMDEMRERLGLPLRSSTPDEDDT